MDKIEICNQCKMMKDSYIEEVKKKYPEIEIKVGCCNLCGIGRTKPFLLYNHIPIIGETFDEVLEKLEERIKSGK